MAEQPKRLPARDLSAELWAAFNAGWQKLSTAPKDGSRVRVGHHLDPSSLKVGTTMKTTGVFKNGEWVCTTGFLCVDRMLRFEPTLWLPGTETGA